MSPDDQAALDKVRGALDPEDVPALEARLVTLQNLIRQRRRTVTDLSANVGLLEQMPPARRGGVESFCAGIVRGLMAASCLFLVAVVIHLALKR